MNSVFENEKERYFNSSYMPDLLSGELEILREGYISEKFHIDFRYTNEGELNNVIIKSIPKEYPDREIKNKKIYSCIWSNDETLFYSVTNEGLYKYNAMTGEVITVMNEDRTYDIEKIEDGYLFFDDAKIKI